MSTNKTEPNSKLLDKLKELDQQREDRLTEKAAKYKMLSPDAELAAKVFMVIIGIALTFIGMKQASAGEIPLTLEIGIIVMMMTEIMFLAFSVPPMKSREKAEPKAEEPSKG